MIEIKVPELGENIESAEVVRVLVGEGDEVSAEQPVLELETDKASFEMPSPQGGRVSKLQVSSGDEIQVGQVVMLLDSGDEAQGAGAPARRDREAGEEKRETRRDEDAEKRETRRDEDKEKRRGRETDEDEREPKRREREREADEGKGRERDADEDKRESGRREREADEDKGRERDADEGKRESRRREREADEEKRESQHREREADEGKRESRRRERDADEDKARERERDADEEKRESQRREREADVGKRESRRREREVDDDGRHDDERREAREQRPRASNVPAAPATRRLARELGVSLSEIAARGDRITREDVVEHARQQLRAPTPELPDFERWGPIERERVGRRMRTAAERLSLSWQTIPHVTQHFTADITELEAARAHYAETQADDDSAVTITALAIRAAVASLARFPRFNSSLDLASGELIYKRYFHIGIAVDTEGGLLVPVLRDAGALSLGEISARLAELSGRARDGDLRPDEMAGGTFTITNLGGLGGGHFTPIINHPEVAILGLARAYRQDERVVLPLSLSYDHRVIDGADAVRFLDDFSRRLSNPLRLFL